MNFYDSGTCVNYLSDIIVVIYFTICRSLKTLTPKSKESKFFVIKYKDDIIHVVEQEVIWPSFEVVFHDRKWGYLHVKLLILNREKSYDLPFVSYNCCNIAIDGIVLL